MQKETQSPLHITVKRKVMDHISSMKTADGYLPPERELCKALGVSRGTLRKAIEQLIKEGLIASNPRKGNYTSSVKPALKIGIIFGNGEAPVVVPKHEIDVLSGEFNAFSALNYRTVFINLRKNPEKELAKYDLDGILWNDPTPNMFDFIRHIIEKGKTPLAAQTLIFGLTGDKIPIPNNFVTLDYVGVGKLRAEYFIKKGITRLAYLGDNDDAPTFNAFKNTFETNGNKFDKKWHIKDIEEIPELLPELLDDGSIMGIVSNGNHIRIENLFRVLDKRRLPDNFVLMIDRISGISDILSRYPEVKVSAINQIPNFEIGETTAGILLEQMNTGKTSPQILLKTQIQEF